MSITTRIYGSVSANELKYNTAVVSVLENDGPIIGISASTTTGNI